jgi:hypothetical protein
VQREREGKEEGEGGRDGERVPMVKQLNIFSRADESSR